MIGLTALRLLTLLAEATNAVKDEAKGVSFREVHRSWTKILDGVRRGGYVSRISNARRRQRSREHV